MTDRPSRIFTTPMPVRFKHCDPAGIAFYPRLLEFANDTVEAWFAELGVGFPAMITERGISTPTVALKAQFLKPCRHGEVLQSRLQPVRLGGSSLDVRIVLAGPAGDPRAEFDITLVCIAHGAIAAVPWPDDLRGLIADWLTTASS